MTQPFSYEEFTTRNIGFVSADEQAKLRRAHVFVAGVGGMGGAAIMCLARAGIGHITLADIDVFEVSNLNRQMVANMNTIGEDKAAATIDAIKAINPECQIHNAGPSWPDHLDTLLPLSDITINGCDDTRATITLMRRAKHHKKTVIDAFASPLPNVYVIRPQDPRPESFLKYPTRKLSPSQITPAIASQCLAREIEWVLTHSSAANHVQLDIAAEMVSGKRKRISFAPMVWTTGCMMAYEAIRSILNRPGGPTYGGVFFNPWTLEIERPRNMIVASVRKLIVRRFLAKLAKS